MTEPTDADRAKAAEITGCKPYVARVETEWDWSYCTTHDVDGNPRWEQCRWAPVAAALAAERAAAVADLRKFAAEELRAIVLDALITGAVMHERGPIRVPVAYLTERADALAADDRTDQS